MYQPGRTTDTTCDKVLKQLIKNPAVTASDPEPVCAVQTFCLPPSFAGRRQNDWHRARQLQVQQ